MDSKPQSPRRDDAEAKTVFRKPNRNYRRRSPSSGSPTSHGSRKRERSSSPILPKGDPAKASEHQQRKKDDEKDLDRDTGRNRYGRSGDSFRHSSRSSHNYSRHDDYSRHEKRADSEGSHHYASSDSGRESRSGNHSDQVRQDSDRNRSREYTRGVDKYSRDKYDSPGNRSKDMESESSYGRKHTNSTSEDKDRDHHRRERDVKDEKKDYHKNSGDKKSDCAAYYEESRGYRNDTCGRDDGHRLREYRKNDPKELNDQNERKRREKRETGWDNSKSRREQIEDESGLSCDKQESSAKKPRPFSSESDANDIKDVNEKQSSSSKLAQEMGSKGSVGQAHADDSNAANDLNAAKVAAMKAAELVNKNLVGVGFMSTEQKKKLLWGSKKSTAPEESGYRWDSALVGDRDRQEKFNKLMGVKGELVEHKVDNQDGNGRLRLQADKQEQLQVELEKQYTAGLRRRDGRTVGLGL